MENQCEVLVLALLFISTSLCDENGGQCSADRVSCPAQAASQYRTFEDIPEDIVQRGHMKELGSHRDPEADVEELPYMISSEDFYEHYVTRHKPVVFKNLAKHWRATKLWTDEYLGKHYGNISLNMETRDDDKWNIPPGRTIGSFLKVYREANLYLVDELPPEMRKDINMPLCVRCDEIGLR